MKTIYYNGADLFTNAHIINWLNSRKADLEEIIRDNAEIYQNLHNHSFWAALMTREEQEMRRHPNRGAKWLPQRIRDEKDEFIFVLLDYFLGPDNYIREKGWYRGDCSRCNSSYDEELSFITDMTKCLESKNPENRPFFTKISLGEYQTIRASCYDDVSKNYDPKISRAVPIDMWEQGTVPFNTSRPYGLCSYCWNSVQNDFDDLIASILT